VIISADLSCSRCVRGRPSMDNARDSTQLQDLVADYAQRALEVILSSDLAREIPLVKTALTARGAIRSVRDEMLLQKLTDMLRALSDVPQKERKGMVDRLESDPKYAHRVGQHLVEIADRIESRRKPRMVGLTFAAFARGQIERVQLERLIGGIERLPVIELDTPRTYVNSANNPPERDRIHPESTQAMLVAGLVAWRSYAPMGGGKVEYQPNATCQKFVDLGLDIKTQDEADQSA